MVFRKRTHRTRNSHRHNSPLRRLRVEPLENRWLLNASYDFGDAPEPYPITDETAQVAEADAAEELLQFTAGGHVLGFASDSVYIATGSHAMHVEFVEAQDVSPQVDRAGEAQQVGAAALGQVSYVDLWEGITLSYDAAAGGIAESTYVLDAGADPGQIQLEYNVPVEIDGAGELVMSFETGQMMESAPIAWQDIDGLRVPVDVSFDQTGEQQIGFALGEYDSAHPLTIDPTLEWNTFLGAPTSGPYGYDYAYDIAVDADGNSYVVGGSDLSWGNPLRAYEGGTDSFVAKLAPDGSLLWNTFLGSLGGYGHAQAVTLDGTYVYVTGNYNASWGSPIRGYTDTGLVQSDAFVAKLEMDGDIVWHTFLGGTQNDSGSEIAVDDGGNVYVGGISHADWGGSPDPDPVRAYSGGTDGWAVKLASDGTLTWLTFQGSTGTDTSNAIEVDGSGNVYVGGRSVDPWGTSPVSPHQGVGGEDLHLTKLDNDGSIIWHTFQGSVGAQGITGIDVDASGNAYVSGNSYIGWGDPVRPHYGSSYDGMAAKFASDGTLTWHTFLGGGDVDYASDVAIDAMGNLYVSGYGEATWGNPVRPFAGPGARSDAFAAKISNDGTLLWNTFLGSEEHDEGKGIDVDSNGNVYVAGFSWGPDGTWGDPVRPFEISPREAFAAKLSPAPDKNGLYNQGNFYLDTSGNGSWDRVAGGDTFRDFGINSIRDTATPVIGDWDGNGADDLGLYNGGRFYLDTSGNGVWDGVAGGDTFRDFGIASLRATGVPVIGDWDGDGTDQLGLFNGGYFYLDTSGNGVWDGVAGGDTFRDFGIAALRDVASPVIGDWTNNGMDGLGLYYNGNFYLDANGNGVWDRVAGGDTFRDFGINSIRATATPLVGDWVDHGPDQLGLFNDGYFYLDTTGNGSWDKVSGGDTFHNFGINAIRESADPVIGRWANGTMLRAAGGQAMTSGGAENLIPGALTPIVEQASAVWAASGLDQAQLERLATVQVLVADLPGAQLGEASGTTITLDVDAAGYGWFVDATPGADEEFVPQASGSLLADAIGPAAGRMDLLSAVMHELGHVLGHSDHYDDILSDDVMSGWLPVGVRRQ